MICRLLGGIVSLKTTMRSPTRTTWFFKLVETTTNPPLRLDDCEVVILEYSGKNPLQRARTNIAKRDINVSRGVFKGGRKSATDIPLHNQNPSGEDHKKIAWL
jgi:hypothetical protein